MTDLVSLLGRIDDFMRLQTRQAEALERIAEALENIEIADDGADDDVSNERKTPSSHQPARLNLAALDHMDR